ncbi:MAG: tetratricopeptide repeat protein [Saprospiraceae bacterium]|nr:tetratricopeptide repeat protein [Saprospiraceae bacterium]
MDENSNTFNNSIPNIVSEYEAMSRKGDLGLLVEKDFIELILYFENESMYDKALEITDLAIERYNSTIDLYLKKAQILIALNNTSEAYKALDQALLLSPSETEVKLLKANCLIAEKEYSRALGLLNEVTLTGSYHDKLNAAIAKATIFEKNKDFNQMFHQIKMVLDEEPSNEAAMEKLWYYMEGQRSYKQGIAYLNELLDRDPYAYLAWYNMGQALSCIGEYENALNAYEYSFLIQPKFEQGYKDCADLAFQMCKYRFALKIYLDALENIGPDSELFACIGECYMKLHDYKQARLNFRKAARLDPYNDEVYYHMGICFAADQKYDIALQHYFKALKIEDSREEYFAAAADAFYKSGDVDKANYYYLKATEIGGDAPEVWAAHVRFLYEIKEYDKAMEVLDEADMCTYSTELVYYKVLVLIALGEHAEAYELLKEAVSEDYDGHYLIFSVNPELIEDQELMSIINYFHPED